MKIVFSRPRVWVAVLLLVQGALLSGLGALTCLASPQLVDGLKGQRQTIPPPSPSGGAKISQLDREIAINFAPWQPLYDFKIPPGIILVSGMPYHSLKEAQAALRDGDVMVMAEGIYTEPLVIVKNNVEVRGSGRVVFDGASAEGKAAIITKGKDISISNIECRNIAVPDQNGACVRAEGDGLVVDHVYFHDSEQGILSGNQQTIKIIDSRFEHIGKLGLSHGIYIGGGELFIADSLFLAAKSEAHGIKSRAAKTMITGSVVASFSSVDSRLVDVSNGGELVIEHSVLEQGPKSANSTAIGYGLEGFRYSENSVRLEHNVIILEREGNNKLLDAAPARTDYGIKIENNVIVSKNKIAVAGSNKVFASRQEAKMAAYPKLPGIRKSRPGH